MELSCRSTPLGVLAPGSGKREHGWNHGGGSGVDGLAECTVHGICVAVRPGANLTGLESATLPRVRAWSLLEPVVTELPGTVNSIASIPWQDQEGAPGTALLDQRAHLNRKLRFCV